MQVHAKHDAQVIFYGPGLYHGPMKADLRISIKDYRWWSE
jgi:hypothetical protein